MTEETIRIDQVRQRAQDCIGKSMEDIDLHMFTGWKVYIRKKGATYVLKPKEPKTLILYMNPSGEKFVSFEMFE